MNKKDLYFLQIAKQGLKSYDIEGVHIDESGKIGHIGFSGYQMVKFRVIGELDHFLITVYDASGDRSIRDYRSVVHSHLLWLKSLDRDTDLVVQKPVLNRSGELITEIQVDDRIYFVTLLHWVEGELVWDTDSDEAINLPEAKLRSVGAVLGQIHRHSHQWSLPDDFVRPESESEDLLENLSRIRQAVDDGRIRSSDFEVLEQTVNRFQTDVLALGKTSQSWGLLHGDFSVGNCVILGNEVRPIDFDWCCFGYYAGDLGWALFRDMGASLRQALLDGYEQYFELPSNALQTIGGFFLESHIRILSWEARSPRADLAYVPHLVAGGCKKYLDGASFLLDYKEEV